MVGKHGHIFRKLKFFVWTALGVLLTGVSGCDSRSKFGYYKYSLGSCPVRAQLPQALTNGTWEMKRSKSEYSCDSLNTYLMTDEKWRNGGMGLPTASSIGIRITNENGVCYLYEVFKYDVSDNKPEDRLKNNADIAANAFADSFDRKISIKYEKFEILEKKEDLEKWCR